MRWQRHGDPQAQAPIRRTTAGEVSRWSALAWVRAERGPAACQPCADCGVVAAVWSYAGTDPQGRTDPARYRPRCRSCQRRTVDCGARAVVLAASDVERAARLYRAGASARGIAALLTVPHAAVLRALRAHGVPLRPSGHRR